MKASAYEFGKQERLIPAIYNMVCLSVRTRGSDSIYPLDIQWHACGFQYLKTSALTPCWIYTCILLTYSTLQGEM